MPIENSLFFEGLDQSALDDILGHMQLRHFEPREFLFRQGEPGESLLIIRDGLVEIFVDGLASENFLNQAQAGDIVGEMALITNETRVASAIAVTATAALELKREAYQAIITRYPAVLSNINRILIQRQKRSNTQLLEQQNLQAGNSDEADATSIAFPDSVSALRKLSPEAFKELARHVRPMALSAGQMLFAMGQPFENVIYIVRAGALELRSADGPPVTVGRGRILGIANYFDSTPYLSTATAIGAVKLYVMPAERIQDAEQRYPEIFNAVYQLFTEHIRGQVSQPLRGVWALPARTIMKSPLVTRPPTVTVQEAFNTINQRRIGSLGIVDESERLLGLVTFVSLAEGLIRKNARPDDGVLETVCEKPLTIDPDAPLWKVQGEQARLGAKYLVVTQNDKPLGIISQTDVLYTLVSYQRSVIAQVGDAGSFDELKSFGNRLGQIAHELRQNNRSAGMAVRALSEIHLAVQRRCIELVLDELRGEGTGDPPLPYAFIIMGSGGRKEMMIRTDQDNGIILADKPETKTPRVQSWFMDFCDRVNHRLDELGYEWCTGDIMARNPEYHRTLSEWQDYISHITEIPTEKTARWSNMFFDFETLYGDDRLTVALRNHVVEELKLKPRLLKQMVEDDAQGGPALGLFNRLVTSSDKDRKGKIDLKRNGTRLLSDAARIYALSEGITETNTGDRLSALVRQGRRDSGLVQSVLAAYDELLDLTLGHQLRQLEKGEPLDKLLNRSEITRIEEESLRMAMRILKHLQGRMQGEFGTVML